MTTGGKIGIVLGSIGLASLIGYGIYQATKTSVDKTLDSGSAGSTEGQTDPYLPPPSPKALNKKVKGNPDGSENWVLNDGTIVTLTKEKVAENAIAATQGRGADGWAS